MPMKITPTVKILLIVIFVAFLIQQTADQFFGGNITSTFALVPAAFVNEFKIWQLFTYAFFHGDVSHLFLNMLMLFFIGPELEMLWGRKRFLQFYFFCSLVGGVAYLFIQLLLMDQQTLYSPMLGASGAIYGLLMAYGLLFGERTMLFMMLFPMKAKHFVWILAGVNFMSSIFSRHSGVASVAHLGGMAGGFLFLWGRAFLKVKRRSASGGGKGRRQKKASSGHLRLVTDNTQESDQEDPKKGKPPTWH